MTRAIVVYAALWPRWHRRGDAAVDMRTLSGLRFDRFMRDDFPASAPRTLAGFIEFWEHVELSPD